MLYLLGLLKFVYDIKLKKVLKEYNFFLLNMKINKYVLFIKF